MADENQNKLFRSSPETYREMSAPFDTEANMHAAVQAFSDELYELRKKHHIKDISVVIEVSYKAADGHEAMAMSASHVGDPLRMLQMLAWAFGQEQSISQERIKKIVAAASR